jgi:hypothetical protein
VAGLLHEAAIAPAWDASPRYAVPLKAPPDLFLSYMAHETPRLAWNRAHALSTNLIHGVYGGGVLKLETKEAERVLLPSPGTLIDLSPEERLVLERALASRRSQRLRRTRAGSASPTF